MSVLPSQGQNLENRQEKIVLCLSFIYPMFLSGHIAAIVCKRRQDLLPNSSLSKTQTDCERSVFSVASIGQTPS